MQESENRDEEKTTEEKKMKKKKKKKKKILKNKKEKMKQKGRATYKRPRRSESSVSVGAAPVAVGDSSGTSNGDVIWA